MRRFGVFVFAMLMMASVYGTPAYKTFEGKSVTTSDAGLMALYLSENKVYMEIPLALMDRELLFGTAVVASSDERESTAGVQTRPLRLVRFHRTEQDAVLLQQLNYASYSDDGNIAAALEHSLAPSTLALLEVEEFSSDSSAVLCNGTELFIGDKDYLSPKYLGGYNSMGGYITRDYDYQSDNSFVRSVYADPGSVAVDTEMSYYVTRALFAIMKISENVPFSAVVRTSFIALPEHQVTGLPLERGLGADYVSNLEYDASTHGSRRRYFATRWNVSDKDAPIVEFQFSDDMPSTVRAAARRAAMIWNEGFQREGFAEAVRISDMGSERSVGVSTIDYVRSPGKEVKSSVWTDPRNGRIFKAAIHVDHDVCKQLQYNLMSMTSQVNSAWVSVMADSLAVENCLTSILAHHIGRCLGFRVNLYGSAAVELDTLRSASLMSETLMDELKLNYLIDPARVAASAPVCQLELGRFDLYNINHLYGDASMVMEDYLFLPSGLEPADPRAQSYVLGNDLVAGAECALVNLEKSIKQSNALIDVDDYDFEVRSALLDAFVEQYFLFSEALIPYMGGVYYSEIIPGNRRYVPVPLDVQYKAMDALLGFMDRSLCLDDAELVTVVGLNDKVSDYVASDIFSATLRKALSLSSEPEDEGVTLTRSAALGRMMDYLWKDSLRGRSIPVSRKKMQRQFTDKLMELLKSPQSKDAELIYALAQRNLDILRIAKRKASDKDEKLYYQYLLSQASKALEAVLK